MSEPEEKLTLTSLSTVISVPVVLVLIGWAWAHKTVAIECEQLGSFYDGNKVFECREKSK